jgi:hypothetical protein
VAIKERYFISECSQGGDEVLPKDNKKLAMDPYLVTWSFLRSLVLDTLWSLLRATGIHTWTGLCTLIGLARQISLFRFASIRANNLLFPVPVPLTPSGTINWHTCHSNGFYNVILCPIKAHVIE